MSGVGLPAQGGPRATEFQLEVGERKILQFARKPQIAAVAELVWNALDADASHVEVELRRTSMEAISEIVVRDDGYGITPERARSAFRDFGTTWKAGQTHTRGGRKRILHGRMGEGRLFSFALGDQLMWESVSAVSGPSTAVRITGSVQHATVWKVEEITPTATPGTTVRISVPQGKSLRALESDEAATNLTAKLAFYLRAYPDVCVTFDGKRLDPNDIMVGEPVDLPLELSEEYSQDDPAPVVTFVEWNQRTSERKMLICNTDGIALYEQGGDWADGIVSFTPYLRSNRFNDLSVDDLHLLPMTHRELLDAADKAVRKHLALRGAEISAAVIQQLKDEGIYPYTNHPASPTQTVERRTFDVVVTVARNALPDKGAARRLSVDLIHTALESSPNDLHAILDKVLALSDEDRGHLSRLLARTDLTDVIGAATTVTNRMDFIGALRKIFADDLLRKELREVDQLHPMIARNLWLFGEEWTIARTEVGLTNVLKAHLGLLGDDVVLENQLDAVQRQDGRSGRVDILLFRGIGDDRSTERIVIELKRPTVRVGEEELRQIKSYARAIVENPQYRGVDCKWRFYLVTYEYAPEIRRDIHQKGKPPGLYDDQEEYEVWVKSWGEILHAAEKKLSFFQRQLNYEATDDRVTQHLRESYAHFIPDSLTGAASEDPEAPAG
ncbi:MULTISPECIES: ATP-binding protein [unclassified Streptomyces]|uniref:ATP-binding protein n=1 Tax=unclassified Streptomyces TaxID=2593676 RepID=UPI00236633B2|nr:MULTISPECIES: ATP-binding protein [unclassified Streptomyces]MDF3141820.1 ATP-binding protein [Streptomyces sp. T21Q-yed]WDF45109.1 ATP-binding protein [Streptomyces sp. T12]